MTYYEYDDHQLINSFHVINMYYYRLTFIVPLVLCLIHSLSSSFNHNLSQQQSNKSTSSTLSTSSSSSSPTSSIPTTEEAEFSLARTKPFLKQAIFNKGFGLLGGGIGGGCCPCSECCLCEPPPLPLNPGGDYPDPGIIEEPNGPVIPGLFNRFGSSSSLSSSSLRRVVRRRYVRPNGLVVVEIEEQPAGGFRGGGIFGGGLFSRFIPSAIENGGNFSRRLQITQNSNPIVGLKSVNPGFRERKDRYTLNNNQRPTRIRVNQG